MHHVVLCPGLVHPAKIEEKLSQHDIASYTAKRHHLVCWQAFISVNWAVGGVCKVFACLLGRKLASFGTELLIAALRSREKGCLSLAVVLSFSACPPWPASEPAGCI